MNESPNDLGNDRTAQGLNVTHPLLKLGLASWMALVMFLFWCSLGCPPRNLMPRDFIKLVYDVFVLLFYRPNIF
jgi:hypothetical protein